MFERRRSFRVPFRSKLIFSLPTGVHVGNTDNISAGGISIRTFETSVQAETKILCLMQLEADEAPLSVPATIKRVIQPTSNPEDIPGLGLAFNADQKTRERLENFMDECAKNYEVASTILSYGEPDLLSLEPLISKMHLPPFMDMGELKFHVEHILKAIELVKARASPAPAPSPAP